MSKPAHHNLASEAHSITTASAASIDGRAAALSTLALVEAQHTANLIAYAHLLATTRVGATQEQMAEIRTRLGLDT